MNNNLKKFLIVKTSSLGDLIHAFPIAAYLRQQFPNCQLDWVVEKPFAELITAHPFIDSTICIDTKKWRKGWMAKETRQEIVSFRKQLCKTHYDAVFDLQSNLKSSLIMLLAKGKAKVGFGRRVVHEWPNLLVTNHKFDPPYGNNIREDNLYVVQRFFGDERPFQDQGMRLKINPAQQQNIQTILDNSALKTNPRILVCSGSNWRNKQLPLETLIEMLKGVHTKHSCSFLFAWGNAEEKKVAEQLQAQFPNTSMVLDRLPLPVLQNLMDQLDLVIAMDSLPLHLAGTTGTPTFSVFGASSGQKFCPAGSRHQFVQGPCPYGKTFEKRCDILRTCKTGACIRTLSGHDLGDKLTAAIFNAKAQRTQRDLC